MFFLKVILLFFFVNLLKSVYVEECIIYVLYYYSLIFKIIDKKESFNLYFFLFIKEMLLLYLNLLYFLVC